MNKIENWIWKEKYRAKNIDELLIPSNLKNTIKEYLKENEIPHLLLYGTAGTQKTTTAKILVKELNADSLYINASKETGIDTVRSKIETFVTSLSINKVKKIVILDECDAMSIQAQQSLKVLMEERSKHSRFFLLTNNYYKIIEQIKSRCNKINFNFENKDETDELKEIYFKRLIQICKKENVDISLEKSKKLLYKLVVDCFPDLREIIGILQDLVKQGKGSLDNVKYVSRSEKITELVDLIFTKDILKVRQFLVDNFQSYQLDLVYNQMYKKICKKIENNFHLAQIIIIIGKYLYQNAVVMDKELNLVSLCAELIVELKGFENG